MAAISPDIDLLNMSNHNTTIQSEPDILLADQSMHFPGSSPKLERPFDGSNTLDEPVLVTIVGHTSQGKRPQQDKDKIHARHGHQRP